MNYNGKYIKNGKKYYRQKNKNNNRKYLLNNKTIRQKEETNTKIKTDINLNNNPEQDCYYNIPGFYYDKSKNRYFSLKDKEILNQINNKNKEKAENKIIYKKNKNLSFFDMIHFSRIMENKNLKKYFNRANYLKDSNYINIEYDEDKFPNNIYLFYKNKYLLILDYSNDNNNSTSISIYDIYQNIFIKKIIIEEFYNDFSIIENNLILIDNITKISIINKINYIIESKDKKLYFDLINKFLIKINNIERISMVYNWPLINYKNEFYYYLLWNNFYYFSLNKDNNNNNKLIKYNNDLIYFPKCELSNDKYLFKISKVEINKKFHYINFFINNDKKNKNNFYFFTSNGEIHRYKFKNKSFILKQIITNELLFNLPIIKICYYNNNNFLLISNEFNIFNFDLLNQTMTDINYKNKYKDIFNDKKIKYKIKIFEYDAILNCIIYEEQDHIIIFSLDNYTEIKKFKIENYKYNILSINNTLKII